MSMNAREFYLALGDLNLDRDQELITAREGDRAGDKVLLTDGKPALTCLREDCGGLAGGGDAGSPVESPAPQKDWVQDLQKGKVLTEHLGRLKSLVVCGAGHVGQGVIRLGKFLGFEVLALDDRTDFSAAARRAGADAVYTDSFGQTLGSDRIPYGRDSYFVVVTRGHRYDRECLDQILKHPFAYLGMMGSRARSARMRQSLLEDGFLQEQVDLLHAPVGLSIGAQTPEEIALSILAQVTEVKRGQEERGPFPQAILDAIGETRPGGCLLATVLDRKGSGPRSAGTRMLVLRDRTMVGTIGGGCMEAEVIREGLALMAGLRPEKGAAGREIFRVDLTGRYGKQADMACGGIMDLLLEVL